MIVTLQRCNPAIFTGDRQELLRLYVHPAYHTQNQQQAFNGIGLKIPDAATGPEVIVISDSEDDDQAIAPKMLPPENYTLLAYKERLKSEGKGRKQKKRFKSAGAVGDQGGARKRKRKQACKAAGRSGGRNSAASAQSAIAEFDWTDLTG